tara:strand:+ start:10876 stop:13281 length:2406 start_codon:yes stop_codon:yes gene_type:complete
MSFPEYKGKNIGFAKVMAEVPVSDGTLAYEILNYTATEEGFLENKFRMMPLIPYEWNDFVSNAGDTGPRPPEELSSVLAMQFMLYDGESPELLFLTKKGVYKFLPSSRMNTISYGSIEDEDPERPSSRGISEQFYYSSDGTKTSVVPQGTPMYPPQTEVVGNRIYFTFCDGGGAYVWDGVKVRDFGFAREPSAPYVMGPASNDGAEKANDGWTNGGGFSDGGRIGTLNYNLQYGTGDGPVTTGGIEAGLWYYAVVFENEDGAYSVTSEKGNRVTIQFWVSQPTSKRDEDGIAYLKRRFWMCDIPEGPAGTVARVLVRTMNLSSLPSGETGKLRFLHRIPNNISRQYMDDIPDSELGDEWQHRRNIPVGLYFMKFFNGSMFLMRTEKFPARVWWSEQGTTTGSIPESFMHSHWRDVFPETGPITGSFTGSINNQQSLLVFKDSAVHYISGSYPQEGTEGWIFGTISTIAGCAGPNLCQSSPDGQIIWYGNGTFWALTQGERGGVGVEDIGQAIRGRLAKVNREYERFGVSWVKKTNKEIVFCLPYKDSTEPDLQFIWDYQNRGWRLRQDLKINAVEQIEDTTIVSGSWDGRRGEKGERKDLIVSDFSIDSDVGKILFAPTNSVWIYGKGYPSYSPGSDLTSRYTTGWMSFLDFGPDFHASQRVADSVFVMEERSAKIATVEAYADWDFDTPISKDLEISCIHPENDDVPVWNNLSVSLLGAPFPVPEAENAIYAKYDHPHDDVYRKRRTYTHRLPVDIPSCNVFSLSLVASAMTEPMALISIDAFGPITSLPGSRSPALYEK